MNLIDKLNTIYKPQVTPLTSGAASSIEEVWEHLLLAYMPKKDVVLAWHNLIMKYVKLEQPTFAIRGYNSYPRKNYGDLRRGFLTKTENFSFFYTDNFFAAYFQKMVLDGYVPTLEEFSKAFEQRKFPSRFGKNTAEERELLAVKQGKDPRISSAGFKLAHVIPVGKDYNYNRQKRGMANVLETFFPKGERFDWKLTKDTLGEFYVRTFSANPDAQKYAVAHFVRFVHPFNYFLCPKKTCEMNDKGKELAEYQPLLDYVHDFMLETYGMAYKEFLNIIMAAPEYYEPCFDTTTSALNVSYGLNINHSPKNSEKESVNSLLKELERLKRKLALLQGTAVQADREGASVERGKAEFFAGVEIMMAAEYLTNPQTSFRKLEMEYLKIESPVRGGGFKAKGIVNSMGFFAEHKGILCDKSIDDLIISAGEEKREVLLKIKEVLSKKKDVTRDFNN